MILGLNSDYLCLQYKANTESIILPFNHSMEKQYLISNSRHYQASSGYLQVSHMSCSLYFIN